MSRPRKGYRDESVHESQVIVDREDLLLLIDGYRSNVEEHGFDSADDELVIQMEALLNGGDK